MSSNRKQRWDAGQVFVTERDFAILRFAGEMYGIGDDVLRSLLMQHSPARHAIAPSGLSAWSRRGWVERMTKAGYIVRRRLLGHLWITPTKDGLDLAGLPYARWNFGAPLDDEPAGWMLAHVHATALVRLWMQVECPYGIWIPEREFRRQRQESGAMVRVPDGAMDCDNKRVGIEIELSRKKPQSYQYILRDVDPSLDVLRWYTRPALRPWLAKLMSAIPKPPRPIISVLDLPES